jgi:hypothetical protein
VNSSGRIARRRGGYSQKGDSTFEGVPRLPEIMCRLALSNREDRTLATTALRLSYREKTCQVVFCAGSNSKPEVDAPVDANQAYDENMKDGLMLVAVVGEDSCFAR